MVGLTDVGSVVTSISDGLEQEVSSVRENENLGVDLLEGLDSYLEDINDWLTISRMVKAVERVAEEKIAAKELEVASLKERLHFHKLGADRSVSSGSPMAHREQRSLENRLDCSFPDAVVEHDKMRESLCGLRSVAVDQIKKLRKDIDSIRGCGSMRKIGSGSELVGLGGILPMEASESLVGVDKRLNTLKTTVDTVCTQADDMVRLAKASLCEWQQEQEFQREFETLVVWSSIRSIHKEFEDKLWDQNAHLCGSQSVNWLERINEVSNLCKELDVILKSLSNAETGQLISHGSHDMDHFHRKALSNRVLPSTSILDGNGKLEESKNDMPENWDAAQFKHMSKGEMVNYFNTMVTKMRRNHESKEKGSSLPLRKDKDLDMLRKKIPEVILKLDDILVENEKIATLSNNVESLGNLNDRLNSLLSENRQLRESLADKRKEVKCLSSQVSDASDQMSHDALAEANLLKLISNLKSAAEDGEIEALVSEEVYKCVLREVTALINCDTEELALQSIAMQEVYEIIYREASQDAEATSKCEIGDSDIESLVMQGLCGVFFKEAIKDAAQSQINDLNRKYLHQNEILVSLELKALKNEEESRLMIEEKDGLKQEVLSLEASLKEKDKLALELSAALDEERVRSELASQESNNLKDQTILLQTLVSERSKELDLTKGELEEVLEQIDVDEAEMNKLNQKLELKTNDFREADKQRNWLMAVIQEERVRFELASQESNNLKDQASLLQTLVSERSKELDLTKGELEQVLEQIDVDKAEMNKLNQKLELKTNELREADEQRNQLMAVIQEMQNAILLLGAKENEQSKQMQAVIVLVHGLSKAFSDFERRAGEGIKKNNLRLEESSSQLSSLIQKTNSLKRTEVLYKKKCADLQLAESEMNHQQNGAYYTNLMSEAADYEFVDEPLHQGDPASPISPQIETTEKSQRGRNFTTEEDSMIISAWLNISLDPVQGNEQHSKAYWLRVGIFPPAQNIFI
ncbi:WPP domain-associated protein-like [Camellia sinensis]|uniref:WPP domain-associated protein-like n=1 Tax=Camellia sinensis TaxID=4442 RepID=UPI0010355B1E|nr:WPP domain-associated protein-like [Camellia sinensis]